MSLLQVISSVYLLEASDIVFNNIDAVHDVRVCLHDGVEFWTCSLVLFQEKCVLVPLVRQRFAAFVHLFPINIFV